MSTKSRIPSTILLAVLLMGLSSSCRTENKEVSVLTDPIKIETGYISGTIIGDLGKEVRIYRGIPYAAPPVGDLRWKRPQRADSWSGIRECTVFGNISPQPIPPSDVVDMQHSEDCLYLNVLTPAKAAADNLPVMVWMHGGGYYTGSGSMPPLGSPRLPQNGVVLVTVNMRLGPMGLLAHPLLTRESHEGISGNYMFFDMIAALEWVQRNIAVFGGNAENVTIFGESGGGAKVHCLMASPLARGLFHRAILESGASGGFLPSVPLKDMEEIGEKLFAKLGVNSETDPLQAARTLTSREILQAEVILEEELGTDVPWDSVVDRLFLTDTPANILRTGKQNPAPVITSANLGELTGPGSILMPSIIPDYVNILTAVNKAGQKGYACIFDHVPSRWKQEGCVSFHALEVSYVFGDWDNSTGWWQWLSNFLSRESGAKSPDPGLTDADREVSENMMGMWAQFARMGDPNVEGLISWPAFNSETDEYLYIAEPIQVKSGFSKIAQND